MNDVLVRVGFLFLHARTFIYVRNLLISTRAFNSHDFLISLSLSSKYSSLLPLFLYRFM
jgi:hypothetical protein